MAKDGGAVPGKSGNGIIENTGLESFEEEVIVSCICNTGLLSSYLKNVHWI